MPDTVNTRLLLVDDIKTIVVLSPSSTARLKPWNIRSPLGTLFQLPLTGNKNNGIRSSA